MTPPNTTDLPKKKKKGKRVRKVKLVFVHCKKYLVGICVLSCHKCSQFSGRRQIQWHEILHRRIQPQKQVSKDMWKIWTIFPILQCTVTIMFPPAWHNAERRSVRVPVPLQILAAAANGERFVCASCMLSMCLPRKKKIWILFKKCWDVPLKFRSSIDIYFRVVSIFSQLSLGMRVRG